VPSLRFNLQASAPWNMFNFARRQLWRAISIAHTVTITLAYAEVSTNADLGNGVKTPEKESSSRIFVHPEMESPGSNWLACSKVEQATGKVQQKSSLL